MKIDKLSEEQDDSPSQAEPDSEIFGFRVGLDPDPAGSEADTTRWQSYDAAIRLYLREIQKTKLLSASEERELARRVSQGDRAARDHMIRANLRLVVKSAKRYRNRGVPFLDLIEEGNVGLIKAVDRFKLSKECRFSTYATWWIRQGIERALVNQARIIRLPVHVSENINKMIRMTHDLVRRLSREPSVAELAESLEMDLPQVRGLLVLLKKTFWFEQPMGENNDYFLLNGIEDSSAVSPEILLEDLNRHELVCGWIKTLSDIEQKILTLRFGLDDQEPQTLDNIGKSFGVTRERIRQIETRALEKLKKLLEEGEAPVRQGAKEQGWLGVMGGD